MGWVYTNRPKGMPLKKFFEQEFGLDKPEAKGKILDCASNFRAAYMAYEFYVGDKREVVALVCAIHYVPNDPAGYNFGYKDMDETMGPVESECPARILDLLTPTDNEYALRWRQRCRDNLSRRASRPRLHKGDVITFERPIKFTNGAEIATLEVYTTKPLRFRHDHQIYRLTRSALNNNQFTVAKAAKGPKMKLITKEIAKQLPPLDSQADKEPKDIMVPLKLFCPWNQWTWFIYEYDPATQIAWGYVVGDFPEIGSIDLNELKSVRGFGGLGIERDIYWQPKSLAEIMAKTKRMGAVCS